jgi:hypothetical protein
LAGPPPSRRALLAWALVAGAAVATRTSIGGFMSAAYLAYLLPRIGWRRAGALIAVAIGAFVVLDPFMWFMPLQHIKDLVYKAVYHYEDYALSGRLGVSTIVSFSLLAGVSAFFAALPLFAPRRFALALPRAFVGTLLAATGVLYVIFMSSHAEMVRYFLPITLTWEALFPLAVFPVVDRLRVSFAATDAAQARVRRGTRCLMIGLLLFYNLWSLGLAYIIVSVPFSRLP